MAGGGSTSPVVMVQDPDSGIRTAVETIGGKNRLLTDTNISSVNIPQGQDPIPDTFFTVLTAGQIGDTVRIQIAATANDTTSPDSDMPAVDYTYILVAADVGDEHKLCENIVLGISADTNFKNAKLEADVVAGEERPIVHISSTEFSMTGEFHERPNFGDFAVTTTGTTVVNLDSDNQKIISRPKPTSLARDPSNPHRLGVIGISGTVSVTAGAIDNIFEEDIEEVGNPGQTDMAVNGAVTPVEFTLNSLANEDLFIEEIRFHGVGNGIKFGNFLNLNSTLTNGISIEIKSDDGTTMFPLIKKTDDFKAKWSSLGGWDLDVQAGGDHFLGIRKFDPTALPVLRVQGTFTTDDFLTITIQDNISQVGEMFVTVIGFKKEP